MKSIGLHLLLVAALVFPAALVAAQDAATASSRVKELMEVTGLAESVRAMPAMAGQQGAAIGGDDELGKSFQKAFASSFAAEPILAKTESELVAHYDPAHAAAILAWYASPLGKRVRTASEAVNTVVGQSELAAYAEGLQADPPSQQRLTLVAELDAATESTAQLTELVIQMSRSLTAGMARVMAPDDPAASSVADDELESMRQQLGPMMRNQIFVTLLFTLRNFTDEDVAAYLAFSGSEPYQWFNRRSFAGFLAGISGASGRFAESFAPIVTAAIDVETRDRMQAEARAYGKGREDRECLGESLERDTACTGFECHVQNAGFLRACLEASSKRSDVCAGAPPNEDLQRSVLWRLQQCESIGRRDSFCRSLLGSLQKHCEESRGSVGAQAVPGGLPALSPQSAASRIAIRSHIDSWAAVRRL